MDRTSLGLDADCDDVVNRAGALGLNGPVLTARPVGAARPPPGCKASGASSGGAARGHPARPAPPHPVAGRGLSRSDELRTGAGPRVCSLLPLQAFWSTSRRNTERRPTPKYHRVGACQGASRAGPSLCSTASRTLASGVANASSPARTWSIVAQWHGPPPIVTPCSTRR